MKGSIMSCFFFPHIDNEWLVCKNVSYLLYFLLLLDSYYWTSCNIPRHWAMFLLAIPAALTHHRFCKLISDVIV